MKCQDGTILYPEIPKQIPVDEIKSNIVSGVGEIQEKLLKSNDLLNEIRVLSKRLKPGQRINLNLRVVLYKKATFYEGSRTKSKFTL